MTGMWVVRPNDQNSSQKPGQVRIPGDQSPRQALGQTRCQEASRVRQQKQMEQGRQPQAGETHWHRQIPLPRLGLNKNWEPIMPLSMPPVRSQDWSSLAEFVARVSGWQFGPYCCLSTVQTMFETQGP